MRPERVFVVPRYYLRWIPYLGVELAWLPIGFRQAAFLNGVRFEAGQVFEAPARSIARWSGVSLRTFWRRVSDPLLRWFIEAMEDEPSRRWWERDGRPRRAPSRWRVVMSMPLTPGDQESLKRWLHRKLNAGYDRITILGHALEAPLEELIPRLERLIPVNLADKAVSVQDVVLEVFGQEDSAAGLPTEELAESLALRLVNPSSVLLVTHYFVEKWLPILGLGPGWLVTLLRSECYCDRKTGEVRDECWIAEGYREIGRALGLERPKTLGEWLSSESRVAEWLCLFFHEVERYKGVSQAVARRFKVSMHEALAPADAQNSQADGGMGARIDQGGPGAIDTIGDGGPGANDTIGQAGVGATGTVEVLKDSKDSKSVKDSDLSTTATAKEKTGRPSAIASSEAVVAGSWDLGKLLLANRVDASVCDGLIVRGASAQAFVSWLLYAASPSGKGVQNPVSHAIVRLRAAPATGAGGAFERLAALRPAELLSLLQQSLQDLGRWSSNEDWRRAMGDATPDRLRDLSEQLGLEV